MISYNVDFFSHHWSSLRSSIAWPVVNWNVRWFRTFCLKSIVSMIKIEFIWIHNYPSTHWAAVITKFAVKMLPPQNGFSSTNTPTVHGSLVISLFLPPMIAVDGLGSRTANTTNITNENEDSKQDIFDEQKIGIFSSCVHAWNDFNRLVFIFHTNLEYVQKNNIYCSRIIKWIGFKFKSLCKKKT